MGIMNYSKGGYTGSVGVHTGRNWKGISVLATKAAPSYQRTPAQAAIRTGFGRFNHFVSLFAPEIKYLTSLDVSKKSVRNAITSANRENLAVDDYPYENLIINTGGRQKPISFAATSAAGIITATWSKPTSTVYSDKVKMIVLCVDEDSAMTEVAEVDPQNETWTGTINFGTDTDIYVYGWLLDRVGSSRVGSQSVGVKVAHA